MPQLDLSTLVVVLIALSAAIGIPLALISGPRRGRGALWYWALVLLTLASGSALLILREFIWPVLAIVVGNALIVCAIALLGTVASSMTTRFLDGTHRWFFAVSTGPVLGLLYLAIDSIWPRVAYMAAVECFLAGQLALQLRECRSNAGELRPTPLLAFEILMWIFFAETAVRCISTVALTSEGTFFQQYSIAIAILLAILLIAIGTSVLIWHEMEIRDEAIAASVDGASGLPNEAIFLHLVKGRLASIAVTNGASIALLRVKLAVDDSAQPGAGDWSIISRKVGTRIDKCLGQSDVLARVGDREFGILFRGSDTARNARVLESALASVASKNILGARGQYSIHGAAALMTCESSSDAPEQVIRILKSSLEHATSGRVRVVESPAFDGSRRATGTDYA